jgi:DNA polymerase-4
MSLRALFVDFNAYFASVEQQLQPRLRGKPVAVVPVVAETTCCIAASYEAKRFGIKTGTRVAEARRLCPALRVIPARPELYVDMHHRLHDIVDSCAPVAEVLSIDEMRCELTGRWRQREHAEALAREIKKQIAQKAGAFLTSSIGIAPNGFLAKTASDMQKPDGLVVIEKSDLPHSLHRLALRDLCGIGRNMERRLHAARIFTVESLCAAPRGVLRRVWNGVEGERMFASLRGEIIERPPAGKTMLGHSHVLPPHQRNAEAALAVLHRLLQKAAMRLRKIQHLAGGMQLSVEFAGGDGVSDEMTFLETQDTIELTHTMLQLWQRHPRVSPPPLLIGVNFFHLVAESNCTPPLFPCKQARRELLRQIDALNLRYGKNTVYFGGSHTALDSAPMRIAFNRIPDSKVEA